jgi:hypothetical protein
MSLIANFSVVHDSRAHTHMGGRSTACNNMAVVYSITVEATVRDFPLQVALIQYVKCSSHGLVS